MDWCQDTLHVSDLQPEIAWGGLLSSAAFPYKVCAGDYQTLQELSNASQNENGNYDICMLL